MSTKCQTTKPNSLVNFRAVAFFPLRFVLFSRLNLLAATRFADTYFHFPARLSVCWEMAKNEYVCVRIRLRERERNRYDSGKNRSKQNNQTKSKMNLCYCLSRWLQMVALCSLFCSSSSILPPPPSCVYICIHKHSSQWISFWCRRSFWVDTLCRYGVVQRVECIQFPWILVSIMLFFTTHLLFAFLL